MPTGHIVKGGGGGGGGRPFPSGAKGHALHAGALNVRSSASASAASVTGEYKVRP